LSREWHPTKNKNLTPKDVTTGNNNKAWWLCSKGHEWPAVIQSRSRGAGCPYCIGLYASEENNLQVINPKLAEEWHPVKNGNLTPKDVLPKSNKKRWWRCTNGHDYQASVISRSRGKRCPDCPTRKATAGYNLRL
jgi:hypothetical protein